ncbi:MAG: hypothetical protein BJ554DRAFT_1431, partial [Olpidium bornovanus]
LDYENTGFLPLGFPSAYSCSLLDSPPSPTVQAEQVMSPNRQLLPVRRTMKEDGSYAQEGRQTTAPWPRQPPPPQPPFAPAASMPGAFLAVATPEEQRGRTAERYTMGPSYHNRSMPRSPSRDSVASATSVNSRLSTRSRKVVDSVLLHRET